MEYEYASYDDVTRSKFLAMLTNASGIRDTGTVRILHIGTETLLKEEKKQRCLVSELTPTKLVEVCRSMVGY